MKPILLLILFNVIGHNVLQAQYVQKNVVDKKPIYISNTNVTYAHFLTDNSLIVGSINSNNEQVYLLYEINDNQVTVSKDITNSFNPDYELEYAPNKVTTDIKRKVSYYTDKEGSSFSDRYRYYFFKNDKSSEKTKLYFYGRGINEEITTYNINQERNLAYVGYNDGVIDTYDLTTTDKSDQVLLRLNRIYSNPTRKIIKLDYCNATNYIVESEVTNVENPKWVRLKVWDSNSSKLISSLKGETDYISFDNGTIKKLKISKEGTFVVAAGISEGKEKLMIWNLK